MVDVSVLLKNNHTNSDGTKTLILRVRLAGKYVKISLEIAVNPEYFSTSKQRVLTAEKKHEEYNHLINDAKGRASHIFLKYKIDNIYLASSRFKREFKDFKANKANFLAFIDLEINRRTGMVANSTTQQHKAVLKKLRDFKQEFFFLSKLSS